MELIPEQLVEESWQEVGGFTPYRIDREFKKVSENQPNLLAFMTEFIQDLNQDVQGLALYMFFVVYWIFKKASRKRLKKISAKEIVRCYETNEDLMENLDGAHEKFLERIARTQLGHQPYVMKYVTDTLMKAPEGDDDPVFLTDQDIGYLFLLLKTVIDLFDKGDDASRKKPGELGKSI